MYPWTFAWLPATNVSANGVHDYGCGRAVAVAVMS
jgi:hypothetical protein